MRSEQVSSQSIPCVALKRLAVLGHQRCFTDELNVTSVQALRPPGMGVLVRRPHYHVLKVPLRPLYPRSSSPNREQCTRSKALPEVNKARH